MEGLKCSKCQGVSTAEEWDDKTLGLCINRQQRRKFKGVKLTAGQKRWYLCPKCGEKVMRNEIIEGEQ